MIDLKDLPNPLPRNMDLNVFLFIRLPNEYRDRAELAISTQAPYTGDDRVHISKEKVTFSISNADIDIPGIQIESLKKQKQQVLAEAHVKAEQIEQQIQSLLAIEYQPESDGAA